jgi:hypothetical protein
MVLIMTNPTKYTDHVIENIDYARQNAESKQNINRRLLFFSKAIKEIGYVLKLNFRDYDYKI